MVVLDEEGDQNILTASASGTNVFNLARTGNLTVATGYGLDTLSAGTLALGNVTATTVSIGDTAATTLNLGAGGALTRAINIGTGTGQDTISIGTGATTADAISIGGLSTTTIDVLGITTLGDGGNTNYASFSATGDLSFLGSADAISFASTSPTFTIGDTGALTFDDGTHTLFTITDESDFGNATASGSLASNTGIIGINSDASANNILTYGAIAGSAAGGDLYWGNSKLCESTDPNCGWATGSSTNYWQLSTDSKGVAPANLTYDLMVGSDATSSAKFVAKALEATDTVGLLELNSTAITTGTVLDLTNTTLTDGKLLSVQSTSTALDAGYLAFYDWSPTSWATASGDLFNINLGQYADTTGNIFSVTDNSSNLFTISQSKITSALPHEFTAAGDVKIAYDLIFTNQTASTIDTYGPLTISAGESFESNNLTLTTYNSGNILLNTGATAGKVGIGASITPTSLLYVSNTGTADMGKSLAIFVQDESQDIIAASKSATTRFRLANNGALFVDLPGTQASYAVCHTNDGQITATPDELVDCTGTVQDYAEEYPTDGNSTYGDIVTIGTDTADVKVTDGLGNVLPSQFRKVSKLVLSTTPYQTNTVGIVSNNYGDFSSTGHDVINPLDNPMPVALSGRVPVKVTTSSPAINPGDFVTTSSDPGRAMKADQSGMIIGIALEDWSPNSGKDTVMVYVNNTYHIADNPLNVNGDLNIATDTQNPGYYNLVDNQGNIVDKISGITNLITSSIQSGIANVTEIISPTLRTSDITPLPGTSDVAINIGQNGTTPLGRLLIKNSNGDTVAAFDEEGNASLSGQLVAGSLDVNGDATISGDLNVGTIYADNVVARNAYFSDAQTASISGITRETIEQILADTKVDQLLLDQTSSWSVDVASGSANLANITADDLYVANQAAINSLSVTNSIVVGSDLVISSTIDNQQLAINSIDTLSAPLSLQSSAAQPIYLMAGKIVINTNGDVEINGNLKVAGNIETTQLNLKQNTNDKVLGVVDTAGAEVANITSSGSAEFRKLSTDTVELTNDPSATSSSTLNGVIYTSNASAGQAEIPTGNSEVTVQNPSVKADSLVFVTQVGQSNNNTIYIKNQTDGQFVVGFDNNVSNPVKFNWWIVDLKNQ